MPWGVAAGAAISAGGAYLSSKNSGDAADDAAQAQIEAAQIAANESRAAREQLQTNLEPYMGLGSSALPAYKDLLLNPESQKNYLQSNPVYNYGVDQATKALFANQAAKGKLGSGGTSTMLTDRILGMGEQFLNNRYQNLLAPINIGQNSAALSGNAGVTAAGQIGNAVMGGASRAANYLTDAAAYQGDQINTIAQTGAGLLNYFSPRSTPSYSGVPSAANDASGVWGANDYAGYA